MITLYYTPDCSGCLAIKEALQNSAVDHEVICVPNEEEKKQHFSTNVALPILKNEHVVYSGFEAICEHLKELLGGDVAVFELVSAECSCRISAKNA